MNELLLLITLVFTYLSVVLFGHFFGKSGLQAFIALASILANIELMLLIKAFSMEQTLGNIIFASTFLVSDILNELYGKKEANKAVWIGIASQIVYVIFTQSYLLYIPSVNDTGMTHFKYMFNSSLRLVVVGFLVFAFAQKFDVWAYNKVWNFTEKKSGNKRRYLWIRNNASTLISQFLNNVLFTFGAFYGVWEIKTMISVAFASYFIAIFCSICETPFMYLARSLFEKKNKIKVEDIKRDKEGNVIDVILD